MRQLLLASLLVPLLCTCDRAQKTLFQTRTDSGVTFANTLNETEDFNIVEYLYYYNGGGVAATDISGDGLPDLYFTRNQGPNEYYVNEGNFRFRKVEGAHAGAGDWSTGISVVDINRDGRQDLYVCNVSGYKGLEGRNELFLQNEDGTFTESAADYGLDLPGFNTQAYWFDYDLDGDLDVYILRHSVHNDATYGTAESRYTPDSLAGDLLLRNDLSEGSLSDPNAPLSSRRRSGEGPGERPFTNVTAQANLLSSKIAYGLSATIADLNQDGYPDIYVCNDFSENDYYYVNQGNGNFQESVRDFFGHTSNFSMGSDAGDVDGDGRPDLFTLDMRPHDESVLKSTMSADQPNVYNLKRELGYYHQLPHNALQWNRGGGNFSEIAEMAGVAASDWSWSCLIEDFDLDGRPDIFVANGIERRPNSLDYLKFISSRLARSASNLEVIANMPGGHVANRAFRNTGELAFEDVADAWGLDLVGSSTGAATADFDGDGDLDLVLNNLNAPATVYENTAADGTVPAERLALKRNKTPLAAQRGMMSQSGLAEVRVSEPVSPKEKWYSVKGTGIVRIGEEGSYFDKEPLALERPKARHIEWQHGRDGEYFVIREGSDTLKRYEWDGMDLNLTNIGHRDSLDRLWLQGYNLQRTMYAWQRGPRKDLRAKPFTVPEGVVIDEWGQARMPTGIWQSISWGGDTSDVLIAGNLGLNTVLGSPDHGAPVRLYDLDFDGNGKTDPVLTYVRDGQEMTVADKDELSTQLPGLRRNQLGYTEFASMNFQELFPNVPSDTALVANTLAHFQRITDGRQAEWVELPRPTQITPLNAALEIPAGTLLAGNKLDVLPRIGRQDAAALQLLEPDGTVEFVDLGGANNRLEIRQLLRLDDNHVLLVVAEGEHLILSW